MWSGARAGETAIPIPCHKHDIQGQFSGSVFLQVPSQDSLVAPAWDLLHEVPKNPSLQVYDLGVVEGYQAFQAGTPQPIPRT